MQKHPPKATPECGGVKPFISERLQAGCGQGVHACHALPMPQTGEKVQEASPVQTSL